jgi:predicted membrane protein
MRARGTFFAVALIVAGIFLFLDNLGVIPIAHIGAYWPLALVVYGLAAIFHRRTATAAVWSLTLVAGGVLLTLGNLHILRVTGDVIWPILLIAFGVTMLVNRSRWEELSAARRHRWEARRELKRQYGGMSGWDHMAQSRTNFAPAVAAPATGNQIHEVAVFFSSRRRVEAQDFERAELSAVFGSIDLDLSGAAIQLVRAPGTDAPARRALLEASAVFGSIDIVVPRDWRIVKDGHEDHAGRGAAGVFGCFEDKTIPSRPEPGVEPPTLVLRGAAVFGSVTIHN